jgi:c-di-AMP phosphodiesterase-like protein
LRNTLVQLAKPYKEDFLIVCYEDGPVDKTILAQTSEALLKVKGCKASFTIARADKDGFPTAVSARSDGTYNVQKVMEKLQGGGHFSAAAAESSNMTPKELKKALLAAIDQEEMV